MYHHPSSYIIRHHHTSALSLLGWDGMVGYREANRGPDWVLSDLCATTKPPSDIWFHPLPAPPHPGVPHARYPQAQVEQLHHTRECLRTLRRAQAEQRFHYRNICFRTGTYQFLTETYHFQTETYMKSYIITNRNIIFK